MRPSISAGREGALRRTLRAAEPFWAHMPGVRSASEAFTERRAVWAARIRLMLEAGSLCGGANRVPPALSTLPSAATFTTQAAFSTSMPRNCWR